MTSRLPLKFLHLYVLISLIVFLTVKGFQSSNIPAPDWVFNHLNDFLVIPIVATICLNVVWIIKEDWSIRLDIFTIISLVILFSVAFEYYLPKQSPMYTGDILDVVCYFLGGVVFYLLQKKSPIE